MKWYKGGLQNCYLSLRGLNGAQNEAVPWISPVCHYFLTALLLTVQHGFHSATRLFFISVLSLSPFFFFLFFFSWMPFWYFLETQTPQHSLHTDLVFCFFSFACSGLSIKGKKQIWQTISTAHQRAFWACPLSRLQTIKSVICTWCICERERCRN